MTHHERNLYKRDLKGYDHLHDRVYDKEVEIVELCVGCIYLRYPDQQQLTRYQCECGSVIVGLDEMEDHARRCEETNADEWFDLFPQDHKEASEMVENNENGFERYEDNTNWNVESCSYSWPLDGHRFRLQS